MITWLHSNVVAFHARVKSYNERCSLGERWPTLRRKKGAFIESEESAFKEKSLETSALKRGAYRIPLQDSL